MKRSDAEYERWVRAKTGHRHEHVWFHWDPYFDGTIADPHNGRSRMLVCDVPDCDAVKVVPR